MNESIKKIIIIVVILIIILVSILLCTNIVIKNNEKKELIDGEYDIVADKTVIDIDNINIYYTVKDLLNSYIYYNSNKDINGIINLIDKQYVNLNDINEQNLFEKIDNIEGYPIATINNIKQKDSSENITSYFVNYDLVKDNKYLKKEDLRYESYYDSSEDNTTQKENCDIVINLDNYNMTFSIMPNYNLTNNFDDIESIEKNNSNEYKLKILSTQEKAEKYLEDFKDRILYSTKKSYEFLDDEYKNNKFKNYEDYEKFVKMNEESIYNISLQKYKEVNLNDDNTEYICIDQYGNYYIFKEMGVMNYTVQLDTYTIDSQEFIDKYNNSNEQVKVGMNLEKIFQALNRKDYEFIYNKLDSSFKQNNFPTLEDFENYATSTFFSQNKIEYGNFKKQAGVYVYNVILSSTDENTTDNNSIEKDFIVKLEEGTDFKFSFNVNA